jgi:hypothetical protein
MTRPPRLTFFRPQGVAVSRFGPDPARLASRLPGLLQASGLWSELPAEGFVLLSLGPFPEDALESGATQLVEAGPRLVLLHVDRADLRPLAQALSPAAMVDEFVFEAWQRGEAWPADWPVGLYARRGWLEPYETLQNLTNTDYALVHMPGWPLERLLLDLLRRIADAAEEVR